jgi:hypothetical protein
MDNPAVGIQNLISHCVFTARKMEHSHSHFEADEQYRRRLSIYRRLLLRLRTAAAFLIE